LEVEEEDDECSKEESDKKSPDSRCSAQERKPPVYYHDEYAGITTAKHTALFVAEADWPADSYDRRSTSGNVFVMSNGAISWASQKQPMVALSTAEAEYIALCLATQESVWL
jgi:hypothetical protein